MPRWLFLLILAALGLAIAGSALIILREPPSIEQPTTASDGKPVPDPCEPQNTVGKVTLPDCPNPQFPTPRTP